MEWGPGSLMVFLPALLVGCVLGGVGGIFGIGGGVVAIPALTLLFGMDQQLAQGTALLMMLPNVLIGFWRYRQRNPIPLRTVFAIAMATIVSTYPAARFAVTMNPHALKICFAIFLGCLSLFSFYGSRANVIAGTSTSWNERYLPAVGIVGGVVAGLFSAGAGPIAATIFVRGFGKRQVIAQGLALALVVPGTVVALIGYAQARQVDWTIGLPLSLGGIVTVSWGVALAHRLSETRMRQLFAALLMATSILMIRQGMET